MTLLVKGRTGIEFRSWQPLCPVLFSLHCCCPEHAKVRCRRNENTKRSYFQVCYFLLFGSVFPTVIFLIIQDLWGRLSLRFALGGVSCHNTADSKLLSHPARPTPPFTWRGSESPTVTGVAAGPFTVLLLFTGGKVASGWAEQRKGVPLLTEQMLQGSLQHGGVLQAPMAPPDRAAHARR